jgi:hypothetical protein
MNLTESLRIEVRELVQMYGLDAVKRALDKEEDAAKERSCSDDRPVRAWNE